MDTAQDLFKFSPFLSFLHNRLHGWANEKEKGNKGGDEEKEEQLKEWRKRKQLAAHNAWYRSPYVVL